MGLKKVLGSEVFYFGQALTALEDMIERDWLSSTYETTEEITSTTAGEDHQSSEPVWIPPTTAAVALRIRLLDDALAYSEEAKVEREKQEIEDEINQKHVSPSEWRMESLLFLRSGYLLH